MDAPSDALANAFDDDPMFGWLLPNAARRRARLVRFFKLELRHAVLPTGRVWTAEGTPGASLELPRGAWKMPIGAQVAHGPGFARVFGARLPVALALITLMERRHLRAPHVYIPYIGVATHTQDRGSAPHF